MVDLLILVTSPTYYSLTFRKRPTKMRRFSGRVGTCQKLPGGGGEGGGNFEFGFGNEVTHPCNGSEIW